MRRLRSFAVPLALALATLSVAALLGSPRPSHSQAVDVYLNIIAGGGKKLNLAMPEFTAAPGSDPAALRKKIPEVADADLTFSGLFSVASGIPPLPADDPAALRKAWSDAAAAGAHAGLHGFLAVKGDRAAAEIRLYDLTSPDQRLIAAKRFDLPAEEFRRLAHKIADEVVYQFTGEPGIADTKIAHARAAAGSKELYMMDYDGAGIQRLTANQSINLSPAWSPDARSVAFMSYMKGYPYLYRLFAFERRPIQLLAGFLGLNSSPAWSPDGKSIAMTLTKDGNPEIYVLNVAAGTFRRLTNHRGIDTEPSWSPTGREIAFVSERAGTAQIFVMDADGANVRRLTFGGGFNTQPRWSPKGDQIAYTSRHGGHDIWVVNVNGENARQLTAGAGNNESAAWAPNGRHLVFQSSRLGRWQLFTMLADGSEQKPIAQASGEATSPSWSPRFP